jgi:D-alanyl-D-alanine carboxypeptidase
MSSTCTPRGMRLPILGLALLTLAGLHGGCTAARRDPPGLAARIEPHLVSSAGQRPFNGVVVVAEGLDVRYARAWAAEGPRGTGLARTSRFVIGSLAKQFTAALVLQQVDSGRVALDAPLAAYLDLEAPWAAQVQVQHLLNHTSGIVALDRPLDAAPGVAFKYANLGYDLLGEVVARTAGVPFAQAAARLFHACGMADTAVLGAGDDAGLLPGYDEQPDGTLRPVSLPAGQAHAASGGIVSTADDLVHWNACLHGGQVLSASSYEAMMRPSATRAHRWGMLG